MKIQPTLIIWLALVLLPASASASPMVYVITGAQQFGTVDLGTGAFRQIGPDMPEGSDGLVPGPKGSLLTLTFSGNLDSINPATGVTTVIGPTGLGDCTFPPPASPCGPTSASNLGGFGGALFATDLANNLYTVDPLTGAAKLLGPTGIPPLPFQLLSTNPDGSTNVFDQTLFGSGKAVRNF